MGIGQLTRIARRLFRFDARLIKQDAIEHDRGFVTFVVGDVPAGETLSLALSNPTADRSIDILDVDYSALFDGEFTIYDSFSSAPSGGTALSPDSLLLDENGSQTDTAMTAVRDATFTSDGDPHFRRPTTAAGVGNDPSGTEGIFGDPVVEPGRSIVVELANQNSSTGVAGIGIQYAELDRVPSRLF